MLGPGLPLLFAAGLLRGAALLAALAAAPLLLAPRAPLVLGTLWTELPLSLASSLPTLRPPRALLVVLAPLVGALRTLLAPLLASPLVPAPEPAPVALGHRPPLRLRNNRRNGGGPPGLSLQLLEPSFDGLNN